MSRHTARYVTEQACVLLAWVGCMTARFGSQLNRLRDVWGLGPCLVKSLAARFFSQVTMLQDNMQAIWGTVNLRARTRHWKQQRILRAVVHWLRTSQMVLHVLWVPTHLQPADPLSRVHDTKRGHVQSATDQANRIWTKLIHSLDQLKLFGTTFVPV